MKRIICPGCERPISVCLCHRLKSIDNLWPVWILQDPAEKKHAIGTAKIATLCLSKVININASKVLQNTEFTTNIVSSEPVLIYPGESSLDIETLVSNEPRPLLFLDGSWRKTRKMFYDIPQLNQLQRLCINPDVVSRYRIRKAPDTSAISTIEAIVYVLSVLDKTADKYSPMLDVMDWMIEKQIEHMGADVYLKNYKSK